MDRLNENTLPTAPEDETLPEVPENLVRELPSFKKMPPRLQHKALKIVKKINRDTLARNQYLQASGPMSTPAFPNPERFKEGESEKVMPPAPSSEDLGMDLTPEQRLSLPIEQQLAIEKKSKEFLKQGRTLTWLDKLKDVADRPEQLVPFVSSAINTYNMGKLIKAGYAFRNGEATEEEKRLLIEFANKDAMEPTFGNKVVSVLAGMPSFAGELLSTSGLYSLVKKGVYEAGVETLSKIIKNKAMLQAGKFGAEMVGGIAGGTAQTFTSQLPRIVEGTVQGLLPEVTLDPFNKEQAVHVFVKRKEDIIPSLLKAVGNQWVETVSERSGGIFNRMEEPVKNLMVKVGLTKQFLKLNPGSTVYEFNSLLKKMGWNGMVGEMMEERIGEVGRASLGLETYKLPTMDQLAMELVAFSIPMVGQYVSTMAMEQADKPYQEYRNAEDYKGMAPELVQKKIMGRPLEEGKPPEDLTGQIDVTPSEKPGFDETDIQNLTPEEKVNLDKKLEAQKPQLQGVAVKPVEQPVKKVVQPKKETPTIEPIPDVVSKVPEQLESAGIIHPQGKVENNTPAQDQALEQVSFKPGEGLTEVQKTHFVNELLKLRDKLVKENNPDVEKSNFESEIVPYLTESEVKALNKGGNKTTSEKLMKLGLLDENFQMTEKGKELYDASINNKVVEEGKLYIKIPNDGEFRVNKSLFAVNTLLGRLGVRSKAAGVESKPKENTVKDDRKYFVIERKTPESKPEDTHFSEYPNAKPVENRFGLDLFYVQSKINKRNKHMIVEGKTGLPVGLGNSYREAYQQAITRLEANKESIEETIRMNSEKRPSPRYSKQEPTSTETGQEVKKEIPVESSNKPSAFRLNKTEQSVEPVRKQTEIKSKIIKRSEIGKRLSEKLQVPIRFKRLFSKGASGEFKPESNTIRIRDNYFKSISHEVGHFLYQKDTSLRSLVRSSPSLGALDYKPERGNLNEGWSEFLRFYITGETEKISDVPFYKTFMDWMSKNTEYRDIINTARDEYSQWKNMSTEEQFKSEQFYEVSKEKKTFDDIHTRVVTDFIDKLHPLAKMVEIARELGIKITDDINVYEKARLQAGWTGKAQPLVDEYKAILEPIKNDYEEFSEYLNAKRQLWLKQNRPDVKIHWSEEQLQEIVSAKEKRHPDFNGVSEQVYKFQDDLLFKLVENGIMKESTYHKIKTRSKNYVPLYRVMDSLDDAGYMQAAKRGVKVPVKRIGGSEKEVIDPLESILRNIYIYTKSIEQNNIHLALTDLAGRNAELGKIVERVPHRLQAQKFSIEEVYELINRKMKAQGEELESNLDPDLLKEMITIFRPMMYSKDDNIITVLKDGNPIEYYVDKDIYKSLTNMDVEEGGVFVKFMQPFASLLRTTATTISPDFPMRNLFRDQWTAFVFSKYGYKPFIDMMKGIFSMAKQDKWFKEYQSSGAWRSSLVSMDRNYIQANMKELLKITKGNFLKRLKDSTFEILKLVSEYSEIGTRLGAYINAREKGATVQQAGMESRDLTMDFQRQGAKLVQANKIVAFLTANVNGIVRPFEEIRRSPGKFIFKTMIGITLPSLLLYMLQKDDDRYKQIPQWQKDIFWIITTKKHIIRIPKPPGLGQLFGTIPELALKYALEKDPKTVKNVFNNILQISPASLDVIPALLKPIVEVGFNYSTFRKHRIETEWERKTLLPKDRYNLYTSKVAIKLGGLLNISPKMIDNVVSGYTAAVGTTVLKLIDLVSKGEKNVPQTIESAPVLRAFLIREPVGQASQSLMDFYDNLDKITQTSGSFNANIDKGEFDKAQRLYNKNPASVEFVKTATKVNNEIQEYNRAIKEVILSDSPKEDKLKAIQEYGKLQTQLAQDFNKYFDENKGRIK